MRMHSYGKCSPNLVVGALTVFTLIVLYNYWNISTLNRDLVIRLRTLEQQVISMSNANEKYEQDVIGLQSERSRLQQTLQNEEKEDKECQEKLSDKEREYKLLQNDLEISRRETQNSKDDNALQENKLTEKNKEVLVLKDKITSLEAQIAEKSGLIDKLNVEITELHDKIENQPLTGKGKSTSAKSTAASSRALPMAQPGEQLLQGEEPKLLNDPADGHALARDEDKRPSPLKQPGSFGGGEDQSIKDEPGNVGVGVLPVPENKPQGPAQAGENADQMQQPLEGGNLDAAEDDLNRQFKEDAALQDDQSPDGALPPKELGVGPAPAIMNKQEAPQANSGQDVREEAHLKSNDI